jgi:hypothetical protein
MNTSKCPCCGHTGDVTGVNPEGQETSWLCPCCRFHWCVNQEFLCLFCGKNMQGRLLFCSDECEESVRDVIDERPINLSQATPEELDGLPD